MTILHKKIHPQELKEIVDFAMQNDSDSESEIKNNAVIYFEKHWVLTKMSWQPSW